MRILLVQPDYLTEGFGFRLAALPEPLHLEIVAALAGDHEVRILDMRLDHDLAAVLREFQPRMVGVTALTPEVYAAQDVVRQAKAFSKEIFTVVGGHHASLLPEDFMLAEVDAIAIGEAELVVGPLVTAVADGGALDAVPNLVWRDRDGQFVHNQSAHAETSLDDLPLPRRDLTARYRNDYSFLFYQPDTTMMTARGCPYRCAFCSVWKFHDGRTRKASARRVVAELATIGTEHVTFVDDNFLLDARREDQIADLIRSEGIHKRYSMECRTDSIVRHPELVAKWADIGLMGALLGLEGAGDSTLKSVNKSNSVATNDRAIEILHEHSIMIWGAFIIDPDWTEDDFKRLQDYVHDRRITMAQYTVLTPLPGTDLYSARFSDLLTHDYSCYDTLHSVLPTRLPREVFYQNLSNLYRHTSVAPYYDLVRNGRMTVDDCRRGKAIVDAMSKWERFLDQDPVLGKTRARRGVAS